jgi:hypothetical protein
MRNIATVQDVNVVADAHFPLSSTDRVFPMAVMEHLTRPWLFAAQINKLLKSGGLILHTVLLVTYTLMRPTRG